MDFRVGDIVKFAEPMSDYEKTATFKVIELRLPRLLLEDLNPTLQAMVIKPTTVHDAADLVLADD